MYIFLDESGSFVSTPKRNSWNVIVAYMMPEFDWSQMRQALVDLQISAGARPPNEIKLRDISERDYFDFLSHLNQLHGILFTVATDAGLNSVAHIGKHRNIQATEITRHIDVMRYEAGRQAVKNLSDRVRNLPPQLYIQLKCQVILIQSVIHSGTLYFVQRFPEELGKFSWRIDQKNSTKTEYEKAFEILTPPWLQSFSLEKPIIMKLEGADYSAFKRFEYPEGKAPTYLKTEYGIDTGNAGLTNIGQLIREDLKFVDSKQNYGVQIADLLATGLRRCLRARFNNNQVAARLLGSLMPQGRANESPVQLLGFSKEDRVGTGEIDRLIRIMGKYSRAMSVR
ncbi:MAG: DUF3800 domain-containing protein [Desulfurellaceae bacterium]|nr:DUF3800 domain-containing protein [Desulfurellaceae bacterium]